MVGLAGTVSTLSMIDLGLAEYDEAAVHHHWLSLEAIRGWRDTFAAESVEAHRSRPGGTSSTRQHLFGREDPQDGECSAPLPLVVDRRLSAIPALCFIPSPPGGPVHRLPPEASTSYG